MIRTYQAFIGATAFLLGSLSCDKSKDDSNVEGETNSKKWAKNVLLVTLDTTRADRLAAYGFQDGNTPWMDALAKSSLVFDRAYAPTPVTLPSHTSMLTGVFSNAHGVRDNGIFRVSDDALLVSEVLQSHGYQTGASIGAVVLDQKYGVDQGFDSFKGPDAPALVFAGHIPERRGDEVIADAMEWIESIDSSKPFFLWIHLYDPHAPYEPPSPFAEQFQDPYIGEIAYCDFLLAQFSDYLKRKGFDKDLAIVLAADHGESLGQHDETGHGVFIYDATQWVPLIISAPNLEPSRRSKPVPTTAIAPTILDLVGLDSSILVESPCHSLLRSDYGTQPIYFESLLPFFLCRWHPLRGWLQGDLKLIEGSYDELYDIGNDPGELNDLASENPEQAKPLRMALDSYLEKTPPLGWEEALNVSSTDKEALKALGYAVGSNPNDPAESVDPFLVDLAHPKDRVGDLTKRTEANEIAGEARYWLQAAQQGPIDQRPKAQRQSDELFNKAAAILSGILERNPSDPSAAAALGTLEVNRGRFGDAIPPLEKAVTVLPSIPNLRHNLAISYYKIGKGDWAVLEVAKCLSFERKLPDSYRFLMDYLSLEGKFDEAYFWAKEAGKYSPEIPGLQARTVELRSRAMNTSQDAFKPRYFEPESILPEGVRSNQNQHKKGE